MTVWRVVDSIVGLLFLQGKISQRQFLRLNSDITTNEDYDILKIKSELADKR
jgi:hypothetical protein